MSPFLAYAIVGFLFFAFLCALAVVCFCIAGAKCEEARDQLN